MDRSISYDKKRRALRLAGLDWPRPYRDEGFTLHVSELSRIKASEFRRALASAWDELGDIEVWVCDEEIDYSNFDYEFSVPGPIQFLFSQSGLVTRLNHHTGIYTEEEDEEQELFESTLAALLGRHGAHVISMERDLYTPASPWRWFIDISSTIRGRTLKDLYETGYLSLSLLLAVEGGELTRTTTLELLRAGRAEALIGLPEGPWLDVKSSHYDLSRTAGKISIAQAVARFANAEHGGIVVVGMRGKKIPGGELIHSICAPPIDARTLHRYHVALKDHLYPPPDFLQVEQVPSSAGNLVIIHVPPQPEELKPFLVHGSIVDGAVEGAFVSIVRRRGEESIPITAAAIHSTLAAGRALLRRGQLPTDADTSTE
ncbi:RNA-binding domain-containing protein [Streptomyces mirabilis]|uniref:RNA-binding domain-containing protein n=1 Tax=Streptomyces mirabilis TaxID=68239 RepID=UPI0036902441